MRVVIVGNGITGVTAAKRIRDEQPDWSITVVSGESPHHYSRPALMYIFMGHMRYADTKPFGDHYWTKHRIELVHDWVTHVDTKGKRLSLANGERLPYDRLLLATGSTSNKFGWPGQDLTGVQGLYDLMDLKRLYDNVERCTHAVIVGGGLIGIELAEMLRVRNVSVTFLVREPSYWSNVLPMEESAMVNRLIRAEGIDLRLGTELAEILDDGAGRARAVRTKSGDEIACQIVGLTAGVSPNIALAKDAAIQTGRGILVDDHLRTSAPDVFAAGDCAEIRTAGDTRNTIEQVWYTGQRQGDAVGGVMAGRDVPYTPRLWHNSAKFFDLEYQVYGLVNRKVPNEKNLYWEHPDHLHALRLVYTDDALIGVNVMGLRYRHEVCERWILDKRPIEYVLEHLAEANFDPEFHRRHEGAIRRAFEEQLACPTP